MFSPLRLSCLRYVLGGIYFDADVLFLRDMWPLWAMEFSYKWSYLDRYNTAVIALHAGSHVSSQISEAAMATAQTAWAAGKSPFRGFHPHYISRIVKGHDPPLQLHMLPCALFDPLWLQVDGHDDSYAQLSPFATFEAFMQEAPSVSLIDSKSMDTRNRSQASLLHVFFRGAFTYHWHNQWDVQPGRNAYFAQFEKLYRTVAEETQT